LERSISVGSDVAAIETHAVEQESITERIQLEPELVPAGVVALHAPSRAKVMLTSAWRSSLEEVT